MVAIFAPAFLLPLLGLAVGLRQYWRDVGGVRIRWADCKQALRDAATMRSLKGGHGQGCNFEEGDRFSKARVHAHHAIMYGFLLCFASTSTGTVMHYVFDIPAPYGLLSLPKLFGISGGVLLTAGCFGMLLLKSRSNPELADSKANGADSAFTALLGFVGLSGLVLYALGQTALMPTLLALHLGAVLAFFLLTPFTKMAHAPFRLAALLRDAQERL